MSNTNTRRAGFTKSTTLDSTSTLTSESLFPAIRDKQGRFVPGVSGNPAGRPKDLIRAQMREWMTPEKALALIEAYYEMALTNPDAANRFVENHDGKLTDKIEHSGELTLTLEAIAGIRQRADRDE